MLTSARAISSLEPRKIVVGKRFGFLFGVDFEDESGVVLEVKSLEDFVGSVTIVHEVAKSPHAKMEKAYRTISLFCVHSHPLPSSQTEPQTEPQMNRDVSVNQKERYSFLVSTTMTCMKSIEKSGFCFLIALALFTAPADAGGRAACRDGRGASLADRQCLVDRRPGEYSRQVLSRRGLVKQFEQDPEGALAALHTQLQSVFAQYPELAAYPLFALAELSFLHAEQLKKPGAEAGLPVLGAQGNLATPPVHNEQEEGESSHLLPGGGRVCVCPLVSRRPAWRDA